MVALALVDGGYFATSWGVLILAFALAAGIASIVAETYEAGWRDLAFVTGLASFGAWQLASILWSDGADAPVLEAERTLIYVMAVAAILLGARRSSADAVFAGLGVGVVIAALAGLVEHLAADPVTVARLAQPIGYANADGLLAGSGMIFALAAASRGHPVVRAAGAAAVVPLATGLYLTLSRGAILATALGLVCMLAIDRRRIEAVSTGLLMSPPVLAALAIASRSQVTGDGSHPAGLSAAGRLLLAELAGLALCAAVGAVVAVRIGQRVGLAVRVRRLLEIGLALTCVVAVGLAIGAAGGPVRTVRGVIESFAASAPAGDGGPSARLTSGSGSYRAEYWKVAWLEGKREPVRGTGAGSFERWWLEQRLIDQNVRDAHNLYLEVFAELGLVGLLLLCVTLAVPLTAMARTRHRPLVPAASGVYIAYLAHASLDWDWELPILTITALGAGAVLIVSARTTPRRTFSVGRRLVLVGVLFPVLALAVVIHAGQARLEQARRSLERGNDVRAIHEAHAAERWLPWATEPWQVRGEALLAAGDVPGAAQALRHASRMNPSSWEVWYDLALVEHGAARIAAHRRAAKLNPRSPEIAALRSRRPAR